MESLATIRSDREREVDKNNSGDMYAFPQTYSCAISSREGRGEIKIKPQLAHWRPVKPFSCITGSLALVLQNGQLIVSVT